MVIVPVIKLAFLALLIIVFIGLSPYIKKGEAEGFVNPVVEGFQTSDGIPTDAQNPTIADNSIYGIVPQAASFSIFKKTEARAATANPDGLAVNEKSGSVEVPLTEFPQQPADPEDIQTILETEVAAEGFFDYPEVEGFQTTAQANQALQDAAAAKAKADAAAAIARDPGAAIYGKATAGASAAVTAKSQAAVGSALAATGLTGGAAAAAGVAAETARAQVQAKAEAKAQEKVMALARAKAKKLVGKQVAQAKRFVVKGAKKVATKITNKLSAKLGATFLRRIISKIAAKIAVVIGRKAAVASAQSAAFSASVIMAPIGILLGIIAVVGIAIQIAMAAVLKGDEGVCETGWVRVSEKWPSYLDNIPGVGDLMGALAPYMCYMNRCNDDQEEDAGLCYTKCEPGYKGVGPVCWTENVNIGVGVLKGCPAGWNDDGLICRQPLKYNPISCSTNKNGSVWPHNWTTKCSGGDFSGGRLIGKLNAQRDGGGELACPGNKPNDVDGLCYADCPLRGGNPFTITRKWPVWIRPRSNKNEVAAAAKLDAAKAAAKSADEIQKLTVALGDAVKEDLKQPPDMNLDYIRNPEGPRVETPVDWKVGQPVPIGARMSGLLKYTMPEPEWTPMPTQPAGWPTIPGTQILPTFAAGKDRGVYVFYNNRWVPFNTYLGKWSNVPQATRIAASCNGYPVIVDTQKKMWRYVPGEFVGANYDTSKGAWKEFGGAANDIAGTPKECRDPSKSLQELIASLNLSNEAIVGTDGRFYRWRGAWNVIGSGGGTRIVTPHDSHQEFIINAPGQVYRVDFPNYVFLGITIAGANDLTITPSKQLIISTPNAVFRVNVSGIAALGAGNAAIKLTDKPAADSIQNVSADIDGFLYVQTVNGTIYKSNQKVDSDLITKKVTLTYSKMPDVPGGGAVDVGAGLVRTTNPDYKNFENWARYVEFTKKYPYPAKTTLDFDLPVIEEQVSIDPRKRLRRIPGMPYQCMGERGIAYGRGVGKPKLQIRMVKPTPPPPPPPPTTSSAYYADDQMTPCKVDFTTTKILQDMCQFYYRNARMTATENADKSISYGYISKVTAVVASSEQSCDILCDITSVVVNPVTGAISSTKVTSDNDRRFYFAKLAKACTFVVTAATNLNGTAPDVKDAANEPKALTFVPTLDKCADIPLTLRQCNNKEAIDAMMKMYMATQPPTVRVKQIDGAEVTGTDMCTLSWQEATYDAATNKESAPMKKVGRFIHTQNKSNEACAYTLQKFAAAPSTITVAPLTPPIVIDAPLPKEVTLKGCTNKCSEPLLLQKLVDAFNKKPGNPDRILSVKKAFTAGELRCDVEAEVYVKATKKVEIQAIRFDMAKEGASCVFSVQRVGEAGSGTFIQKETAALGSSVNTQDFVMAATTDAVKAAQTKLSGVIGQMTGYAGKANTAFEKTFADVGQLQTLGTCAKKCSDQDILEAIVNWYNTTNYPSSRTNVTKKSISRIIKAGTTSKTECDITFEEKQEYYTDLYNDAPKVTITQKTQRFVMKETSPCQFAVDASEGFQNPADGGLPMKRRTRPSVVNNASPLLTPPFSSSGCELDCTKKEVLDAVKQKYDSATIEGFSPRPKTAKQMGFFETIGSWLAPLSEAFQDVTEGGEEAPADTGVTDWTGEETVAEPAEETPAEEPGQEMTSEEAAATTSEDEWVWDESAQDWVKKGEATAVAEETSAAAEAPKPQLGQTLKGVNRALKLTPDKCEYEVMFDKTEVDESGTIREQKGVKGYMTATFTKDPKGCVFIPLSVTKSVSPVIPGLATGRAANISYSF